MKLRKRIRKQTGDIRENEKHDYNQRNIEHLWCLACYRIQGAERVYRYQPEDGRTDQADREGHELHA